MSDESIPTKGPEKKNPLSHVKTILAVFGGLSALSSLSKKLIEWKGFILDLIEWYQAVAYPVFDIFLEWFETPHWVYDYLMIGLLVWYSCRQISFFQPRGSVWYRVSRYVLVLLVCLLNWPFVLLRFWPWGKLPPHEAETGRLLFQWLLTLLILFAILLTINTALL